MLNPKKIERLVKRRRWNKINKLLEKSDSQTRIAFATELGNSKDDNAYNLLILLLDDSDEEVRIQTIKSLGNLGRESAKTYLQRILMSLPQEESALGEATREAISKINEAISLAT